MYGHITLISGCVRNFQNVKIALVLPMIPLVKGDGRHHSSGRQCPRKWCEKLRGKVTGCVAVGAVNNTGPTYRDQPATGPTFLIPPRYYHSVALTFSTLKPMLKCDQHL